uniref:Serine/threonine-protein kinase BSK1-like TPR repeats domain-containing protein n=1 Tax=Aegilops tauschii subsp. strangulata TaxID=200361 RepID=A0A453JG60_AEGTS
IYRCLACTSSSSAKERDRWSPEARFIEAAHNGDVGKIKKIAKELDVQGRGIPVTVANTTYMGMNALHAAAGCGSFSVFQYLVEEVKMDVDLPDTAQQFTPVAHAVTNGNLPAVKYLIDHGADVHQQRAKGNITLLHAAAVHGYSEIVKFLLARGADVNAVSDLGTALTHAAIRGFPSIVKTLLEHNADGGAKVSGDSPRDNLLVKAAEKGLTEAIKCLLEAGANPNVPNTFGRLPIELAAEYGTREDVEILFPFTSPISTVANWSVDGIISHVKMEIKQLEDDNFVKERVSDLKRQADEAFKKQDYLNASVLYTQALKMDNFDAKLLSNRSLCWLRMGDGQRAFDDATKCKRLRPKWAKAHYRQGSALMFMKVH